MAALRMIHNVSEGIACILGLSLNALLIYSIKRTSNAELKKYSRVLLQSAFVDLIFLTIAFIAKPVRFLEIRITIKYEFYS